MEAEFSDLLGKTLTAIQNSNNEELYFHTTSGDVYKLFHYQECCESVLLEDVCGDLADLIGEPLLMAEEIVHAQDTNPEGVVAPEYQDSFTWTFYKLATIKGSVTLRWYGDSNGYYSESVEFVKL